MGWEDGWIWECCGVFCVSGIHAPSKDGVFCGDMAVDLTLADKCSGNLDLPPYLPFLGKTQLQILSFLTSVILMVAHIFTSWAVTERVLLRDE